MRDQVERQLRYAVDNVNIPELKGKDAGGKEKFYRGKVRDGYTLDGNERLLVSTDRISAFDHVLGTIPYKGAVLNSIAAHFLQKATDVFPNAFREVVGANAMIQDDLEILPVEAIVRAYVAGSAARDYFDRKMRKKCGIDLSAYLLEGRRNERFTELLFTPSTKAEHGHDEDITEEQILKQCLMTKEQLNAVKFGSLKVFKLGEKLAAEHGLILVDTKFEYGLDANGNVKMCDEVLTPDSSRYWIAESYTSRYACLRDPDDLSKEFLRQALIERIAKKVGTDEKSIGGMLDTLPRDVFVSVIDDELRADVAMRYLHLYKQLTGNELALEVGDPRERLYVDLKKSGKIKGYFVPIIAGSASDDEHVKKITWELAKRGIPHEHRVCSAHRDPVRLVEEVMSHYEDSIEPVVYVTVAALSNGLSSTVAGNTGWPVIACPPGPKAEKPYSVNDIWSTIRTPPGVPPMAVLEPANVGAAVQRMFGLFDAEMRRASVVEIETNRRKGAEADKDRRN